MNYSTVDFLVKYFNSVPYEKHLSGKVSQRGLQFGLIFPAEFSNVLLDNYGSVEKRLVDVYGFNVNNRLHVFFSNKQYVKNTSEIELKIHQLLHYLSTYGNIEELQNNGSCYVPELGFSQEEINDTLNNFKNIIAISKKELKNLLKAQAAKNIAYSQEDLSTLYGLLKEYKLISENLVIGNKELACMVNIDNPQYIKTPKELVRILGYLLFGKTLFVNSEMVKTANFYLRYDYSSSWKNKAKLIRILESYQGNKNFRAYRDFLMLVKKLINDKETTTIINRLIRYSHKHENVNVDKSLLLFTDRLTVKEKKQVIKSLPVHKCITVYNEAVRRSTTDDLEHYYLIRNAKSYTRSDYEKPIVNLQLVMSLCKEKIVKDYLKKFANELIYLPTNVNYALPSTARQLVGAVPSGSYIELPYMENITVGCYWTTQGDIDLSVCNLDNGDYVSWIRSHSTRTLTHSGDMTGLNKHGIATELVACDKTVKKVFGSVRIYSAKEDMNLRFFVDEGTDTNCSEWTKKEAPKFYIPIKLPKDSTTNNVGFFMLKDEKKVRLYVFSVDRDIIDNNKLGNILFPQVTSKITLRDLPLQFTEDINKATIDCSLENLQASLLI